MALILRDPEAPGTILVPELFGMGWVKDATT
jgi:hypothetical protein